MHGSHSAGLWHPKSNASGDQLQQLASSQDTSLLSQGTPRSQPRLAPLRHVQHVANYEAFWLQRINSVSELSGIFPPHPITADKVAIYIQDELLKPGATANIKEVIDALDLYRFDHLLDPPYLDYEARDFRDVSLRSDVRIRQYEAKAARLPASDNAIKSVGISEPAKSSIPSSVAPPSTPRITIYDMSKLFMRMLQDDTATLPHSVHANIRERAWLVLSRGVAPCLDSRVRLVLWSDLDFHSIAISGCVRRQPTLFILSDNGRMNDDDNKLWIHGAMRHRLAEMCSVGSLGFYFYSYFHILKKPPPDFAPDFSEPTGEYGRRKWYLRALFPRDDEDDRKLMSMQHCFDRTRSLHSQVISGAGESQFKSADYELYNAGRSVLQPPATLMNSLFPWINDAEAAYQERLKKFKHRAQDLALVKFLTLLYGLRKVILQDAAVLFLKYPNCNMFKYEPFDSLAFRTFIRQCKVFYREMGKRQAVWRQESLKVVNSPPKPLEEKMRDVLEVFDDIEMDDDTSTLRSSLAAAAAENTSRPNGQAQLPPPRHTRQSIPAKPSSTFTAGFFGEIVR